MPDTSLPVFPPQLAADGSFLTAEQGSDPEIASAMAVVILWPQGARLLDEEFGTPELNFETGGADLNAIRASLQHGEPRALEQQITQDDRMLSQFVSDVTVGFTTTAGQS